MAKKREEEDSRDIFEKALDYVGPAGGAIVLGGIARKIGKKAMGGKAAEAKARAAALAADARGYKTPNDQEVLRVTQGNRRSWRKYKEDDAAREYNRETDRIREPADRYYGGVNAFTGAGAIVGLPVGAIAGGYARMSKKDKNRK